MRPARLDPAVSLLAVLDEAAERGWVERIEHDGNFDYSFTPDGLEALSGAEQRIARAGAGRPDGEESK